MIQPFEMIELSGTPFSIGKTHGERASALINNSLKNYKKLFKALAGVSWPEAQRMARDFIQPINACDPEILEEMQGIASGSGLSLEDVIAINARSELLYSNSAKDGEGCTAVAVMPERTACGRLLMGQNWDYTPLAAGALVMLRISQQNKPEILMVTEAGMVGKIGMNSCGLCTGLNALSAPSVPKGVPVHVALRLLLNGENLTQATAFLEHTPVAGCGNIILGSAFAALNIEIGPDDFDVLCPRGGLLVHTNHYLSPRFAHYKSSTGNRTVNSYIRQSRMEGFFENTDHKVKIKDLKQAFSDHGDYPDGICRHPDPKKDPPHQAQTNYSVIFDMQKLEMHLSKGNPCSSAYEVFSLS